MSVDKKNKVEQLAGTGEEKSRDISFPSCTSPLPLPLSSSPRPRPHLHLQGAAKFKQTSKIGNSRFRQLISDFGPSFVIVCMSILAAQPFISNSVFIGEACHALFCPVLPTLPCPVLSCHVYCSYYALINTPSCCISSSIRSLSTPHKQRN
jgi:hypothetical protein